MKKTIGILTLALSLACGSGGGSSTGGGSEVDPVITPTTTEAPFYGGNVHLDFLYYRAPSGNVVFTVHNRPESATIPAGCLVTALIKNVDAGRNVAIAQYQDLLPDSWMAWESGQRYDAYYFMIDTIGVQEGNIPHPIGSANISGIAGNPQGLVDISNFGYSLPLWKK